MREKLIEYVHSLFRNAPKSQKNQDLEAEILQNSLDRFDDLVSRGVPEQTAYTQAVDSIGNVNDLLEGSCQPQTKKKRTGRIVAAAVAGVAVLGIVLAVAVVFLGINSRGSFRYESLEDRVEDWADDLERDADHWAEGIEENMEQWVDRIDEEYGYSVIAPNSSIGYTDSERYSVGAAEVEADSLTRLTISWLAGDVTVEAWDGDTISISETGGETEAERLHWLLEDGELSIQYCASGIHKTLPRKELTVRVPEALAGQLRWLLISGTSQDMTVTGLTAFQVNVHSTSGTLEYTGGAEQLRMETTSGNMTVKLDKAPDHLEFDSVSGSLTLSFPEGRGFEVEWDTVSGDFTCEFPGQQSDDEWVFNPEENNAIRGEFEFDTVSGDVTIKKE